MRALIFDFNGTMVDDMGLHKQAWLRFLREKTGHELTDHEFLTYVCGPSNVDILRRFCGATGEAEVAQLAEQKESIYRDICAALGDRFRLIDGLPELLDALAARGVPIGIATGAGETNLRFYFERFALGKWFDMARVIYEDGTFPGKPHPETYLRACAALGFAPEDCAVVEDSPAGIESARRAGIGEIVAVTTSHAADALRALPGVSRVIGDYREFAL